MQALLSFDQAPPFSVPVRFMVTAPLFGIAAGLLLIVVGGDALATRWSPVTLALTHLFTVGFLLQVMFGALFQIMPVAVGANLARPLRLARLVHAATAVGALCLVAGFLSGRLFLMHLAAALLGVGIAGFLGAAALALRQVPNTNPTAVALKLALVGLAVTVAFGLALLFVWIGGYAWPVRLMTDLHAVWGVLAWCGTLLAGVAYVVVPMFQLTPGYRTRFSRWFAPSLLLAVLLWSLLRWSAHVWSAMTWPANLAQVVLGALAAGFAAKTLWLQKQSKRSRADATMRYWRVGMGAAVLAAVLLAVTTAVDPESTWSPTAFLIGALALGGGLVSVVSGMLYKILPFLSWLHLQNKAGLRGKVPHMGEYLPERFMNRQFWAHLLAVALFLIAVFWPEPFARLAGVALLAANAMLLANLLMVLRRYAAVQRGLAA